MRLHLLLLAALSLTILKAESCEGGTAEAKYDLRDSPVPGVGIYCYRILWDMEKESAPRGVCRLYHGTISSPDNDELRDFSSLVFQEYDNRADSNQSCWIYPLGSLGSTEFNGLPFDYPPCSSKDRHYPKPADMQIVIPQ